MFVKQDFSLIITIVNKGFSDPVITAAKSAGAEGATIITARGTGTHEEEKVLGVAIQPEKELVLILVKRSIRKKVMRDICKSCSLNDEGRGMTFSVPVDEVGGIVHLMNLPQKFSILSHLKGHNHEQNDEKNSRVEETDSDKDDKA